MKTNRKAIKAGFARWLTVSLAPMSVIIAMACMATDPTRVAWTLWGATAALMLALTVWIEHRYGNHGEAPGRPKEERHSFKCQRCETTEHSTSPIAHLKFTDGQKACMKCGKEIFSEPHKGWTPSNMATVELTAGEEGKSE